MKAIMIIHNQAVEADVTEALESLGVKSYSKFTDVLGRGQLSEPRLNTDVWPGTNIATFIVTDQNKAKEIMQQIAQMRLNLGKEGLKAFSWQIDEII
jgi:nitrogen regulatory protein PII